MLIKIIFYAKGSEQRTIWKHRKKKILFGSEQLNQPYFTKQKQLLVWNYSLGILVNLALVGNVSTYSVIFIHKMIFVIFGEILLNLFINKCSCNFQNKLATTATLSFIGLILTIKIINQICDCRLSYISFTSYLFFTNHSIFPLTT